MICRSLEDPASTEFARGHMLEAPGGQSDHSGWNDANLAGSDAHSRRRRPATAVRRENAAEKVLRSFNTWAFKREQPSDPHLMQQVISHAITQGKPLNSRSIGVRVRAATLPNRIFSVSTSLDFSWRVLRALTHPARRSS